MAGRNDFTNSDANINDLKSAWVDRIEDAQILRAQARYSTAISMGLYALEILLKVKICQRLDLEKLPKPFEIHELDGLMILSGLKSSLHKDEARSALSNWTEILTSSKDLNKIRYQPNTSKSIEECDTFFAKLNDPTHGVIPWLMKQP